MPRPAASRSDANGSPTSLPPITERAVCGYARGPVSPRRLRRSWTPSCSATSHPPNNLAARAGSFAPDDVRHLGGRGSATAARALREPEVGRREGGTRRPRRAGARARDRGDRPAARTTGSRALVQQAVADGADALGIAGGDGSLAVVAAAALAHGLPFVCVPAGTRNHFALDAGVDRGDLVGSLGAFTDGVERRIDVAEVNGRLFLNNVSLGIYGDAVRQPEYRDAKARTLAQTAAQVLGPSAPAAGLEVVDDHGRPHRDPAVVLVSNNPYSFEPPHAPGTRPALDGGQLGVIVLDRPTIGQSAGRTWTAKQLEVTAPLPSTPALTASLSSSTRRSGSRSGPARSASGSRPDKRPCRAEHRSPPTVQSEASITDGARASSGDVEHLLPLARRSSHRRSPRPPAHARDHSGRGRR